MAMLQEDWSGMEAQAHIWAGISKRSATIVIFTGTLTATHYCNILKDMLLPFIRKEVFPHGYCFQQDNDPKHTSNYTKDHLVKVSINWWKTQAKSPDLNPIGNDWGSIKYYLRHQYKPTNVAPLPAGIKEFWISMTPKGHLHKVILKVVEVNGAASGY